MKRLVVMVVLLATPMWLCAQQVPATPKDAEKPAAKDEAKTKPDEVIDVPEELIKVKLVGVSVMKGDQNLGRNRFWGWMGTGTSLSFAVTASKGCIVGVDYGSGKLTAFRDDLGKDLAEAYRKGLLEKVRGDRALQWLQGSQIQMAIEVCPCALRFCPIECPCSWRSAPSVGRT